MKICISLMTVVMGLWTIMGAVYMMGHYKDLGSLWALTMLPVEFWTGLGIVQILLAVGLIISVWGRFRTLAVPTASALAAIFLAGSVLYSAYVGFPGILWALIPATLFLFIAYKNKT